MPTALLRHQFSSLSARAAAYTNHSNTIATSSSSHTGTASSSSPSTPAYATPRSNEATSSLPQQLQAAVPSCAQSCLSEYIIQGFTCAPNDFSCLCSQYSSQGYTLGELAFTCLRLQFTDATQQESVSVYNVCSAQTSAVSATHSTLTLPATATTVAGVTTTTLDVYVTGSTSSTDPSTHAAATSHIAASSSAFLSTAASSTTGLTTTSTATSSPSSPSATAAAAGLSKSSTTTLTSAQTVGVSIAALGAVIIAVGVAFLVACIRRRKANKCLNDRSSYDFVDEAPPRFPPYQRGYADFQGPFGGFAQNRAELPSEKDWSSAWYREQFPSAFAPRNEKVIEHSPKTGRSNTPDSQRSIESMRTLSQLLPDRPGATPPLPPSKQYSPPLATPATVFEEDKSPRIPSAELRAMPLPPEPIRTLPGRNIRPQPAVQPSRSPEAMRQPSLSLDIPQQAPRTAKIPSPITFPLPPVPVYDAHLANGQRTSTGSRAKSLASTTGGSLLNYYASPDAGNTPDTAPPTPPISDEPRKRKAVPAAIIVTKPSYLPRAVIRNSGGSDTSFESTNPDEPTPPDEEDKQLSPVQEHSPIAAIRYPKVPRSSNQSVPRSPATKLSPRDAYDRKRDDRMALPSHKRQQSSIDNQSPVTPERQQINASTLSGSTLAGKRRGSGSAKTRARPAYIDTSLSQTHGRRTKPLSRPADTTQERSQEDLRRPSQRTHRQESPLKGYGRATSGGRANAKPVSPPHGLSTPGTKRPTPKPARSPMIQQDVVLKSPLWEPKLTPTRRGDGLYLDVGLASPGYPMSPAQWPIVR